MIYNKFKDIELSALAFGTMRLPVDKMNNIDEKQTFDMVDYALSNGVNYFDTAYPYHGGMSEIVVGKALKRYPRDRFYLATKFPGHQISSNYDPKAIFEEQLAKCNVDYFDFYLLHNVYENSINVYMDKRWGILEYFLEQKRNGRIKPLVTIAAITFINHGNAVCLNYAKIFKRATAWRNVRLITFWQLHCHAKFNKLKIARFHLHFFRRTQIVPIAFCAFNKTNFFNVCKIFNFNFQHNNLQFLY